MKALLCSIIVLAAAAGAGAEVLVLQPGAEGKDTYICDCLPDVNNPNGPITALYQGRWGNCYDRILVQWDLSSLPADAVVDSAIMELYYFTLYGNYSGQMTFDRIIGDWGEDAVTFNTQPDTAGEGRLVQNWPAGTGWMPVNVTAWVQGWHAGTWSNYGLYGAAQGCGATCDVEYYSSDFETDPGNRPKLTVWYHVLGVEPDPNPVAQDFALNPVYPNPFNARAMLSFNLAAGAEVKLSVFDPQGREVACLYQGWLPAGRYRTPFDASALPSGAYLARLTAGSFEQIRSLALVK
jgi:hypothetical protein